jgi:hypothetical protein
MLDYTAYLLAQRRVVELARGALPESPVRLPAVASDPVRPHALARLRDATGALLHRLADSLTGSRVLAPPPRPTVAAAAPAGAPSRGSPGSKHDTEPRPTASRACPQTSELNVMLSPLMESAPAHHQRDGCRPFHHRQRSDWLAGRRVEHVLPGGLR